MGDLDWVLLAKDWDKEGVSVNTVINFRIPWNAGKFLITWGPFSFSRMTLFIGVFISLVGIKTYGTSGAS